MRGRAARIYRVSPPPSRVCVTILTCVLLALVSVLVVCYTAVFSVVTQRSLLGRSVA